MTTDRYNFHKLLQQLGQPVKDYIEPIQKQVTKCKFGAFEQEACKNQMVLGVLDCALRERYFQEDDLTFEKAVALRFSFVYRISGLNNKQSAVDETTIQDSNKISHSNCPNTNNKFERKPACNSCGYFHADQKCPAYRKNANFAKTPNHFETQCYAKNKSIQSGKVLSVSPDGNRI